MGNPSISTFHGAFQGFGLEWDPFYWDDNNQNRGCDQAGWDLTLNRLSEMEIKIVRMMMQMNWRSSTSQVHG